MGLSFDKLELTLVFDKEFMIDKQVKVLVNKIS